MLASGFSSCSVSVVMISVVSSAYTLDLGTAWMILLIYMESVLPCGIPSVMAYCVLDLACWVWRDCCRFLK